MRLGDVARRWRSGTTTRPGHSTQRRPDWRGRAGGHHDRPRCHGRRPLAGRVERCCRPARDQQYERDGPRSKRPLRAWAAGQNLMRSVLGAPFPSDPRSPRSRSCCRSTREDYGYPCSIVEVECRTSALLLRHASMPRRERDDEYRCCRCDWIDPSARPSARMSRHRGLLTGHAPHLHLQVDPLVPLPWPFPHHHWSSIAPTGRDDQAGKNQQAWAEHRRACVRKGLVHRASNLLH